MNDQPVLTLKTRPLAGSNSAKRFRRNGLVPGIVYGHGEALPVLADTHEFRHTIPTEHYGSQVIRLQIDGRDAGAALVKAVQLNTVTRQILNVDFQRVSSEDRVNVSVSILVENEPADARAGGVLEQFVHAVTIRCSAFQVPEQIAVDVSKMHIGDSLHAGQLVLPGSCELVMNPEEVILIVAAPTVTEARVAVEPTPTAAEGSGPGLTEEKQKDDFPPER